VSNFIDLTSDINAEVDLTQEIPCSQFEEGEEDEEDSFYYSPRTSVKQCPKQDFKLEFPTKQNRKREGRGPQQDIGNQYL